MAPPADGVRRGKSRVRAFGAPGAVVQVSRPILRAMSPLSQRTIATIGSGVMAEAMIAGILRGKLVEPDQVVASHPRPERREHLAREYGIRVVESNEEAVRDADVV